MAQYGQKWTRGESIFTVVLRTSFMDDPWALSVERHTWSPRYVLANSTRFLTSAVTSGCKTDALESRARQGLCVVSDLSPVLGLSELLVNQLQWDPPVCGRCEVLDHSRTGGRRRLEQHLVRHAAAPLCSIHLYTTAWSVNLWLHGLVSQCDKHGERRRWTEQQTGAYNEL